MSAILPAASRRRIVAVTVTPSTIPPNMRAVAGIRYQAGATIPDNLLQVTTVAQDTPNAVRWAVIEYAPGSVIPDNLLEVALIPDDSAGAGSVVNQISGLVLWLNDTSSKWQESTRITPAVLDTDPVGAWDDASGQGNHALQATVGARPTLKLAIQNGRPVVRFDGVDDFLGTVVLTLPTAFTAIIVYANRVNVNGTLLGLTTGGTLLQRNATFFPNVAEASMTAISTLNVHNILTMRYDYTADTYAHWMDGTADVTDATVRTYLGAVLLGLGSRSSGVEPLAGDIAEVVLYNRLLSTAERQTVERALGARWGVTVA